MDNFIFTPRTRDGAVVVANDLTHLFPYQSGTAVISPTILDEPDDKAKNHEQDSCEAEDIVLEEMRFRPESKEIHGKDFRWHFADLHPLLVAPDSSTLKEDLCRKKYSPNDTN